MPTDTRLMTLMQWLSPGFPTSSFAYSHGLETAIAEGHIRDADDLKDWLDGLLTHGSGRTDAIWIRLAHAAENVDALGDLNDHARAYRSARERLVESEKQGLAFVQTVNGVWECALPPLLLPLAVGASARKLDIDVDLVIPLYLQSFIANLIAAAQRLMPLGQTDAQRMLSRLHPTSLSVSRASLGQQIDDISSTAFMSDIMAMRHETLQPRLFHS